MRSVLQLLAFIAVLCLLPPARAEVILVPANAVWKYHDLGQNLNTAWKEADFDDASWASGPAELGYGDGDEATVVSFGPNASAKYTTTYFRHAFNVQNPNAFGTLLLRMKRDDGCVIYINGTEVFRIGLPTGPISFNTFASTAADFGEESFSIPSTGLVQGRNVVAVEMHQSDLTSTDISMMLEIRGNESPVVALTTPTEGQTFTLPATVQFSSTASDVDGSVAKVEYYAGLVKLGESTSSPYVFSWVNPPEGVHSVTAQAIDNTEGRTISTPVSITVNDPNPPRIVNVTAVTNQVSVTFSRRVSPQTATNIANYSISRGVQVLSATIDGTSTVAILGTSLIGEGLSHTLTVNNVQAPNGQQIANNSTMDFVVVPLNSSDIGVHTAPGSFRSINGEFEISSSGNSFATTSDNLTFAYATRVGDFDMQVRVSDVTASHLFTRAGIMVREAITNNARYVATLATPGTPGVFVQHRANVGAAPVIQGQYPVNYPNTWLRLKREGTIFTGYASVDGDNWVMLARATNTMGANAYLGLVVASQATNVTATARFGNFTDATGEAVVPAQFKREPLGPSARTTELVISEIMYHPKPISGQSGQLEFVEIFNAGIINEDLSGYRLDGDAGYTFSDGTLLAPGQFIVVAKDPLLLSSLYPDIRVVGPFGPATNALGEVSVGGLPDNEGIVRLRNKNNAVILDIEYAGANPWPLAADGAGHSLVLAHPSHGEGNYRAWESSSFIGGSPGKFDPVPVGPLENVVINEVRANSGDGNHDFIELYNNSNVAVDLSGVYLSDDRDTNKFRIANGVSLPPKGFLVFDESELGFALSSAGERIYLVNSNGTRVVQTIAFDAQATGVSLGRSPDGSPKMRELASSTPGASNSAARSRDIVINELMFSPLSGDDADEYIELYNRSSQPVNVGGWRFTSGITYTIPVNTIIPANGFLVVAKDRFRLFTNYPHLNIGNTVGNYNGQLSNGGELLTLAMPERNVTTNSSGVAVTNTLFVVVDEINYLDGTRYYRWADRGGSSLELIDPSSDNDISSNWADSDEFAKTEWTDVEWTGPLDNGRGDNGHGELQVMLLGGGEALVDDLEVIMNGQNIIVNNRGTFNDGLTGWVIQGNHVRSTLSPHGFGGGNCLHLRATSGGDNGANRAEVDLNGNPTTGIATIRGKARWIHGHTNVLFRLYGNYLEAVGTMKVPKNLGTPGQVNSRKIDNAPPAIQSVSHFPVLPAPDQSVVVTARVSDNNGVSDATLIYRDDRADANPRIRLPMNDAGTGGDALAGDGIYSATIPGFPAGTLVAFAVEATDSLGTAGIFPPGYPVKEAQIRFGDSATIGNLGVYRLWMTRSNITAWTQRENLSNEPLEGTFVYGYWRAIYNAGGRYRGSPWIRPGYNGPTGGRCAYVWTLPDDDQMLGADELNLDSLEPGDRDPTALREITSFWMANQLGLPFSHQRYVHVVINGVRNQDRSIPIYTDVQQPDGAYVESWFADHELGDIFKIDDWFEYTDVFNLGKEGWNDDAKLLVFNTTINGVTMKKQARYRWSWEKKSLRGLDDDYTPLFQLVDAVNAPDSIYVDAVENTINIEEWLTAIALRHAIGDWDGWGYNRGKNQFAYKPDGEKFHMLLWDLDFSLGCTGGHPPTQNLFEVGGGETTVQRMLAHPHFRRIYMRALIRAADGPFAPENVVPVIDSRYKGLQANGVNPTSPFVGSGAQGISIPEWIRQRRAFIYTQVPGALLAVTNIPGGTITTNRNVLTLRGTAPVIIHTIKIDGKAYPVRWLTPTTWEATMLARSGEHTYDIQGFDVDGNLMQTNQTQLTINFTGQPESEFGNIVFNEIMYNPSIPEGAYVEIYNRASSAFDIGGYRVNGLNFVFPPFTIMPANGYLLLVKNPNAVIGSAGNIPVGVPVFTFAGNLDVDGETLSLIKPGPNGEEIVVDRVRYEVAAPWPALSGETNRPVQLVDAGQDNSRVSNWSDGGGWRFASFTGLGATTGTSPAATLLLFLQVAGDIYIDDLFLSLGDTPEAGTNWIRGGDFEGPYLQADGGAFRESGSYTNSEISAEFAHSGSKSLHIIGGSGSAAANVSQVMSLQTNSVYTLSFWYLPSTRGSVLNARITSPFRIAQNIAPTFPTPGAANTAIGITEAYEDIWLNEVLAENTTGATDGEGHREPWVEIHNNGTNTISLDGYALSASYSNTAQWTFPSGRTLAPGAFMTIWLDGEAEETTANQLHASFRPTAGTGSIALYKNGRLIDYLNYASLGANTSYGSFPDGQPFFRQAFARTTPGAANNGLVATIPVFINEWAAQNTAIITDPTGQYEDWFELFNAGTNAIDLSGYFLTDDLDDNNKSPIPAGTIIPAGGYLLVFADGDMDQNSPTNNHIHANFSLSASGESLGLFTADGTLVDSVTFSQQSENVTQGRYPDGADAPFFALTIPTPRAANILDVVQPPRFSGITRVTGGGLSFSIDAIAGKRYQLLFKTDLNQPWTEGEIFTSTGVTLTIPVTIETGNKFYTIVQLD